MEFGAMKEFRRLKELLKSFREDLEELLMMMSFDFFAETYQKDFQRLVCLWICLLYVGYILTVNNVGKHKDDTETFRMLQKALKLSVLKKKINKTRETQTEHYFHVFRRLEIKRFSKLVWGLHFGTCYFLTCTTPNVSYFFNFSSDANFQADGCVLILSRTYKPDETTFLIIQKKFKLSSSKLSILMKKHVCFRTSDLLKTFLVYAKISTFKISRLKYSTLSKMPKHF